MIFEFYEQKYVEKVHLKLNLAQSSKQESPAVFENYLESVATLNIHLFNVYSIYIEDAF